MPRSAPCSAPPITRCAPAGYRPLDAFWRARGYAPVPGAVAHFAWKDVDQPGETDKPLQFWMRARTRCGPASVAAVLAGPNRARLGLRTGTRRRRG